MADPTTSPTEAKRVMTRLQPAVPTTEAAPPRAAAVRLAVTVRAAKPRKRERVVRPALVTLGRAQGTRATDPAGRPARVRGPAQGRVQAAHGERSLRRGRRERAGKAEQPPSHNRSCAVLPFPP